jgi:hypothetical protein
VQKKRVERSLQLQRAVLAEDDAAGVVSHDRPYHVGLVTPQLLDDRISERDDGALGQRIPIKQQADPMSE